nr:hypothetical protein [uncultured Bacillus sp.]
MNHIHYKEFYTKALIPIGENEKKWIGPFNKGWRDTPLDISHYLIAMEGNIENENSEKYHWKISVYPADSEGTFYNEIPLYTSQYYTSLHCAFSAANKLESAGKAGQLFVRYLY